MKAHVAIISLPESGHCNPILGLIPELRRRGHRVSFAATEKFTSRARGYGANPVSYTSSLSSVQPHASDPVEDLHQMPLFLLNETMLVLPQLEAAFADDPPDLVLFDVTAWAGWMLAEKLRVPAMQVWPVFASNPEFSLDSSYTVFDFSHPAMVEFAELAQRYLPTAGFPAMTVEEFFNYSASRHLVLLPREFQFAGGSFDDSFRFVGPCRPDSPASGSWRPPANGAPLALISLGTSYNDRADFFASCVKAFADPSWQIVMTVGDRIRIAELGELPGNIRVAPYIPHLDVLPHAQVYVSQAGISGVLEALSFGLPQVLIPQTLEQNATADRAVALRLGVRLPPDCDGARVRDAVLAVAHDEDIRANAREMRSAIAAAGGSRGAADEIESCLAEKTEV
ncbi:MAG TPA: macrolide family glycosyltransferase [Amycolatopsis sp.]|uniref:macrolide family glycosyltransferase n=1 Tax=Amycolatopsis sp. TaxID=37632 RepID=UPI002B4A963C|nr:macrolide family glycosyltransferase [Amycolatopsis sp.]HKS50132.1 macrolide family glycosyltransferase [Amycolatopsis sp.]